jgi:hypothetical protein
MTTPLKFVPTLSAVFLLTACSLPFVKKDDTVRVLVYNIHAGRDAAGTPNLNDVAALVRTLSADVVLLQEVDRGTKRSGGVDQLQVLMDRTDFGGVFGRARSDYDGGLYGIAALARDGFGCQETVPLQVTPVQTRAGGSHGAARRARHHRPYAAGPLAGDHDAPRCVRRR